MKVAIITDTHAGVRSDADNLAEYQDRFYEQVFFPNCAAKGIKTILHGGDIFDKRQHVTIKTMDRIKNGFLRLLEEYDMELYVILGNHDTLFRNTLESNSPSHVFFGYPRVKVISEPTDIHGVAMIPWINKENYESTLSFIANTKSKYCLGHFEICGFEMHRGTVSTTGLDKSIFDRFQLTMSGHFHTKSRQGDILYLGNPFEFNWGDWNDPRGFHIFDTETGDLEFIQNPESMFFRVEYDQETNDRSWSPYKPESIKDKYVKVIVIEKGSPYQFDKWHKELISYGPADLQVVESTIILDSNDNVQEIDVERLAKSNIQLIEEYVSQLEDDNKEDIIEYMRKLYIEVGAQ